MSWRDALRAMKKDLPPPTAAQERQARQAHSRWKMCRRKRVYATQAEAHMPGLQTYSCPHCGGWHRTESWHKRW